MQMIGRRVTRLHAAWMVLVAYHGIEIDHAVERAARADPGIQALAGAVFRVREVARESCAFERSHRGTDYLQATRVTARDQLAIRTDQVLDRALLPGPTQRLAAQRGAGKTHIVHALE